MTERPTDAIVKVVGRLHLRLGPVALPRGERHRRGRHHRPRVRGRRRGGRLRGALVPPGDFVVVPFCHCDNTCAHCRAGRPVGLHPPGLHRERPGRVRPRHPGRGQPGQDRRDAGRRPGPVAAGALRRDGHRVARRRRRRCPRRAVRRSSSGDGAVGLCGVLAASEMGAERVVAMSRHEPRQELAQRFGATDVVAERGEAGEAAVAEITGGVGADAVLECVGTDAAMRTAFAVARPGSTVGFVGVPHGVRAAGAPDVPEERRPRRRDGAGTPLPARPARAGRLRRHRPGLVFDLTLPLDDVAEGYRAMDERRAIKVLLQAVRCVRGSRHDDPRARSAAAVRRRDDSATIWVEVADAATVTVTAGDHVATARTFAAHGHHFALVELDGAGARHPHALHRERRRRAAVARAGVGLPAAGHPDAEARQAAADGVRLVPGERAPRRGRDRGLRRRRAALLRPPHGRRRHGALARPGAVPRRPGLRRRDQRGDAGVHRRPARHRRAAGGGDQGLRGVRPPLPDRLERPGQPLAALDAAERDDLRRPRHPRRLEHQLDVAPADGGEARGGTTASSAGWRRTGSTSTSATSARPTAPTT